VRVIEENSMTMDTAQIGRYITRGAKNDATRRGIASALAGVAIAAVCEAAWPSA
jgi:alkylhydroperoxidase/carboxymuconolactone decarboxylase family protein YurZ